MRNRQRRVDALLRSYLKLRLNWRVGLGWPATTNSCAEKASKTDSSERNVMRIVRSIVVWFTPVLRKNSSETSSCFSASWSQVSVNSREADDDQPSNGQNSPMK